MKIFDIGANAGFYTLAFARLVGDSGHVWAFEPLAENLQNLRRHVAMNALNNVTIVEAAVSEDVGIARFAIGESNSTGYLAERGDIDVPTVSMDKFCVEIGVDCPDLVKLDIEGGETMALRGAVGVLARGKATILLALHGIQHEKNCLPLLRAGDYVLQYLDEKAAQDVPLLSDEIVAFPRGARPCAA